MLKASEGRGTEMTTKADLPRQPEIVRRWLQDRRSATRRVFGVVDSVAAGGATIDEVMAIDFRTLIADSLQEPPAEVAQAYRQWASEYNKIVHQINAERQARINAAEVQKIRSAACPVCFATHAGEC